MIQWADGVYLQVVFTYDGGQEIEASVTNLHPTRQIVRAFNVTAGIVFVTFRFKSTQGYVFINNVQLLDAAICRNGGNMRTCVPEAVINGRGK